MKTRILSISQTLTIAIVGCVLMVSSAVISLNLYLSSQETWQSLENQADQHAAYLSSSLSQPLWTLDEAAVRNMARAMFRNELFVRLKVQGKLLKIVYEQWAPTHFPTIKRSVSIVHQNREIGFLELEISTQPYHEKISSLLLNAALTVAAVLVTLFVLTGLMLNRLLKQPLKILLNRIDLLSQGKQPPADRGLRHPELNQIIECFDEMAQEVTKRETSLLVNKKMLEDEIRERAQVEAELKESEKRYRLVTDVAPIAIIVHRDDQILYANAAAQELLGASKGGELLGCSVTGLVHPDDRRIFQYRTDTIGELDVNPGAFAYRWLSLDGRVLDVEAIGTLINVTDGSAILTLLRDLTQQKRDEADKARLLAQLQQAQKMEAVGTLANGIAHDFNNILQAISGIVQLMAIDGARSGNDRKLLEEIDTAAVRGSELVSRLLTFSRRADIKLAPVDLNHEVERSRTILERTLPKMISMSVSLGRNLGRIEGDASQLEQVILNLGTNARDAMPEGGELYISTSMVSRHDEAVRELFHQDQLRQDFVRLTVRDNGIGMEPLTVEQIFDPFFTTKEVGKGTGLGLSMVYGIVSDHEGRITCHSEKGKGTVFNIYFPVYLGGELDQKSQEEPISPIPRGSETLLLVDDEASILAVAQNLLESLGYSTITARSGEQALECYREHGSRIDAVIMDLGMPGMGGKRCLSELNAIDPEVRVMIASGYSGEVTEQDLLAAGARVFMRKPYRLDDLIKNLNKLLSKEA